MKSLQGFGFGTTAKVNGHWQSYKMTAGPGEVIMKDWDWEDFMDEVNAGNLNGDGYPIAFTNRDKNYYNCGGFLWGSMGYQPIVMSPYYTDSSNYLDNLPSSPKIGELTFLYENVGVRGQRLSKSNIYTGSPWSGQGIIQKFILAHKNENGEFVKDLTNVYPDNYSWKNIHNNFICPIYDFYYYITRSSDEYLSYDDILTLGRSLKGKIRAPERLRGRESVLSAQYDANVFRYGNQPDKLPPRGNVNKFSMDGRITGAYIPWPNISKESCNTGKIFIEESPISESQSKNGKYDGVYVAGLSMFTNVRSDGKVDGIPYYIGGGSPKGRLYIFGVVREFELRDLYLSEV